MTSGERVTHGDLPHWYMPGHPHFVTYRLADSIPAALLRRWREQRERLIERGPPPDVSKAEYRLQLHKQFFARYDAHLDRTPNCRWLETEDVAKIVRENLYHHHGSKYELLAYCVMPNHVHVLLQPFETAVAEAASFGVLNPLEDFLILSDELPDARSPLSSIMHSLKSYTANQANQALGRTGQFWQHESYDHWVRDLNEYQRIVEYIIYNPVKAGLCAAPHEWQYSSARDRFELDGSRCGLVGTLRDDWRR